MPKNKISKSEQDFNKFKKRILDLFCLDEDGVCKMTGIQNGQAISNLKYPEGTRSELTWLKYFRDNTKDFAYNSSRASCAHSGYFDLNVAMGSSIRALLLDRHYSRRSKPTLIGELSKWIFDVCMSYVNGNSRRNYVYEQLLYIRLCLKDISEARGHVISVTDITLTNQYMDAPVTDQHLSEPDYIKTHSEWYDIFRKIVDLRITASSDYADIAPYAMHPDIEHKYRMKHLAAYSNIHAFYLGPSVDPSKCYTSEVFTHRAFSEVMMTYMSTAEILLTTEYILSDVPAEKKVADIVLMEIADYIARKNGLEGADFMYGMHPVHVFNCAAQLKDVIADTRKISIAAMMNRRDAKYGSLV